MIPYLEDEELPVLVHIGPGRCRQIGTIKIGLDDGDEQIRYTMAAALRAAADRLDEGA